MDRPLPDSAFCRECRYRLLGLPGNVCPECGTAFDPDDPESYIDPEASIDARSMTRRRLKATLLDPPSTGYVTLLVVLLLVQIPLVMNQKLAIPIVAGSCGSFFILAGLPLLLFDWIRLCVLVGFRRSTLGPPRWPDPSDISRAKFTIFLIPMLLLMTITPIGFVVRFWISYPFLSGTLQQMQAGGRMPVFGHHGVLYLEYIHVPWKGHRIFLQIGHDESHRYGFLQTNSWTAGVPVAPGWVYYVD